MRLLIIPTIFLGLLSAQVPNPTQNTTAAAAAQAAGNAPIFRVNVVERTTRAVNYRHRSGATKIDFRGTTLLPRANGEAKVESKQGYIEIEVEFDELEHASKFGPEYLTYVMWAITPEGRATNLGEVLLNGNRSKLNVTTELQSFSLLVTAEPYFAVTTPSDVVVIENVIRPDTLGKVEMVDAKFELLPRGQYTRIAGANYTAPVSHQYTPLELLEARNAIQIARVNQADKYASDTFAKAEKFLQQAEDYHARKQKKPTASVAREAVQTAEDARMIALRRMEEERLALERQQSAEREAQARAAADESARQKALAEEQQRLETQRRQLAEQERQAAERARADAERATQEAVRQQAQAESARQAALAQQQQAQAESERIRQEAERARQTALADAERARQEAERARQQVQEADRLRQNAETERAQLRQQLQQQLNMVLETRDSARGLIVNMSDVLFDFGKYTLRPAAREKLAKITGIVLAHPGLRLDIEGHTDSVGSDEFNQKLSEQRAQAVRDYLTQQGIQTGNITARGFGESQPVASNNTDAGRQQNRRVELVVSGDVIGTRETSLRVTPSVP